MFKKRQVNLSNAVVDGWVTRRYVVQSRLAKRHTGPRRRRCPLVSGRRADAGEPFWRLAKGVSKPAWREMLTGCWRSRSCHEPVRRTREYFPHHIDSPCSSGRGGRGRGGTHSGQTGSLDLGRLASATVRTTLVPSPSWHCLTHTHFRRTQHTGHACSSSFARHCPPCSPSVLCTGRVPHSTAYCPAHPRASPSGNGTAAWTLDE